MWSSCWTTSCLMPWRSIGANLWHIGKNKIKDIGLGGLSILGGNGSMKET